MNEKKESVTKEFCVNISISMPKRLESVLLAQAYREGLSRSAMYTKILALHLGRLLKEKNNE